MSLNKSKGGMYPWLQFTWNPIGGECPLACSYCFMKRFKMGELTLRKHFLKDNLANRGTVFVGSSCDMWAKEVPSEWITEVLDYCSGFTGTSFLFQSKNPERFQNFVFPERTILGTTLESNRHYPKVSQAPSPWERYSAMHYLHVKDIMLSVEPVLDFDLDEFVSWIRNLAPGFVSIGADSKGHKLPEPSKEKVSVFIGQLRQFTDVKLKQNLKRLGVPVI